jgi:hypothetical protein
MKPKMDLSIYGRAGLNYWGTRLDEDFLKELRGRRGINVYTEMSSNEPIISSLLFTINMLIRGSEWTVSMPEESEAEDLDERGQFLMEVMDDMEHTWDDFIDEVLTMLPYGWAWHELLFKIRRGPEEDSPLYYSKYNDGRIGLLALPLRGQETLDEWNIDKTTGKVLGMWQTRSYIINEKTDQERPYIPAWKALHFRTSRIKNNPEGRSLLRGAYRPWYYKKNIEMFEGIGIERDLAGYPVMRCPPEILMTDPPPEYAGLREDLEKALQEIKRDEREGLLIPNKESGYDFDLLSSAGQRQFDTDKVLARKSVEILQTVLADFIAVGHEQVGSFALNVSKIGMFTTAINALLENVEQGLAEQLVRPLLYLNGFPTEDAPEVKVGRVSVRDVTTKIEGIHKMSMANLLPFKPPISIANALLRDLDMPELEESDFQTAPDLYPGPLYPGAVIPPEPKEEKKPVGKGLRRLK